MLRILLLLLIAGGSALGYQNKQEHPAPNVTKSKTEQPDKSAGHVPIQPAVGNPASNYHPAENQDPGNPNNKSADPSLVVAIASAFINAVYVVVTIFMLCAIRR